MAIKVGANDFHDGRVVLFGGDAREALKQIPDNSIDSIATDPPYALVSIVKRFGAGNAAPAKSNGATGVYGRASAGFMGQAWDTGAVAFDPEFWAEALRVLKPGGHVAAFGGTRTYHRLACAIEDAGFDIRDAAEFLHESDSELIGFLDSLTDEQRLQFVKLFAERGDGVALWTYGSGFPKSHDVSKGIDKHGGHSVSWFGQWLRNWRTARGIKQAEIAALFPSKSGGKTGCVANWELGFNLPTPEQFNLICTTFDLPFDSIEAAEREIVGSKTTNLTPYQNIGGDNESGAIAITAPATDAARQWAGWGTALKPACEIICLARKPLSEGTVAANVLRWGTGAINVDACRIEAADADKLAANWDRETVKDMRGGRLIGGVNSGIANTSSGSALGRFPANVIHDGSPEVLAGFPDVTGATSNGRKGVAGVYQDSVGAAAQAPGYADSGSAARFFACFPIESDTCTNSHASDAERVFLLSSEPVVSALSHAAAASMRGLALQKQSYRAPDMNVSGLELRQLCASVTEAILNLERRSSLGLPLESIIVNLGLAKCAAIQRPTGIIEITLSRSKSSGYADPVTFDCMLPSADHGASDSVATRFHYTAKADSHGRVGSKHPTIKPVSLMQWLIRLITPPGGVTLDPFAGSGTTGEAALLAGFRAILIEREPQYQRDIAQRMAHVFSGKVGRSHVVNKDKAARAEPLPLFGSSPAPNAESE